MNTAPDDTRHLLDAACQALENCAADLTAYPGNEGIAYLVADRLTRLVTELRRESC